MKQLFLPVAGLAALLSACTARDDVEDNRAIDTSPDVIVPGEANAVEIGTAAASAGNEGAPETNQPDPESTPKAIPAAFQGRWGMVPLDCTGDPAAAKGLIAIDGKTIKFYESRATLSKVTMDAPENFTADFDFTGEGMNWSKSENLKLSNSSKTLTRTDKDGSYTYRRCA